MITYKRLFAACIVGFFVTASASAITCKFIGPPGGDWYYAYNWENGRKPTAEDRAWFPTDAQCVIQVEEQAQCQSIQVDSGATLTIVGRILSMYGSPSAPSRVDGKVYFKKGQSGVIAQMKLYADQTFEGNGELRATKCEHADAEGNVFPSGPNANPVEVFTLGSDLELVGDFHFECTIVNNGLFLVNCADDVMQFSGDLAMTEYPQYILGSGTYEVSAGQMHLGAVAVGNANYTVAFKCTGGTLLFRRERGDWLGAEAGFDISGGTLDIRNDLRAAGRECQFRGAQVKVAATKSATFQGPTP